MVKVGQKTFLARSILLNGNDITHSLGPWSFAYGWECYNEWLIKSFNTQFKLLKTGVNYTVAMVKVGQKICLARSILLNGNDITHS